VLIARHGRILQPGGTQLRYRQWSFGVQGADGVGPKEEDVQCENDVVLYQVFSEETLQAAIREALKAAGMEDATIDRGTTPPARQGDGSTEDGSMEPVARGSARGRGSGGSRGARGGQLDFGLLQQPVVKRESSGRCDLRLFAPLFVHMLLLSTCSPYLPLPLFTCGALSLTSPHCLTFGADFR